MASAYLDFAQNTPDYFRLLNAYDRGDFEQGTSAQQRERLLEASNNTLDIVTQVIADGMTSGLFGQGDPRKMAAVLCGRDERRARPAWATPSGAICCPARMATRFAWRQLTCYCRA